MELEGRGWLGDCRPPPIGPPRAGSHELAPASRPRCAFNEKRDPLARHKAPRGRTGRRPGIRRSANQPRKASHSPLLARLLSCRRIRMTTYKMPQIGLKRAESRYIPLCLLARALQTFLVDKVGAPDVVFRPCEGNLASMPGAGLTVVLCREAQSDMLALKLYQGEPARRNFGGVTAMWFMVELPFHPATERAGLITLPLPAHAPLIHPTTVVPQRRDLVLPLQPSARSRRSKCLSGSDNGPSMGR